MAAYSVPTELIIPKASTVYQTADAITPTDATKIGPYAAFYCGHTGDIKVCPRNSTTLVVFKAVPAGTIIRLGIQGVESTGTTATDIVGLA